MHVRVRACACRQPPCLSSDVDANNVVHMYTRTEPAFLTSQELLLLDPPRTAVDKTKRSQGKWPKAGRHTKGRHQRQAATPCRHTLPTPQPHLAFHSIHALLPFLDLALALLDLLFDGIPIGKSRGAKFPEFGGVIFDFLHVLVLEFLRDALVCLQRAPICWTISRTGELKYM